MREAVGRYGAQKAGYLYGGSCNLVLVCTFHHKLLHEGGWSVCLKGRVAEWYKPDGRRYDPGPDPPGERNVAA